MRVLVCPSRGRYISALSHERFVQLLQEWDVVINEHENIDIQECDSWYLCHVGSRDEGILERIKELLERILPRHVFTPETRGWDPDENSFAIGVGLTWLPLQLTEVGVEVARYDGPSGHAGD